MKRLLKRVYFILLKLIPKKYQINFINLSIECLKGTTPLFYAYNSIGILNWESSLLSGEIFVLDKILPKILDNKKPILFDVGANTGNYTMCLEERYPEANIYSFEPNPYTFKKLEENKEGKNIEIYNFGFGSENKKEIIYTYTSDIISEHASLYDEFAVVIDKQLGKKEIKSFEIELRTIDSFCEEQNLDIIDFLKIDVEGHEFFVLKGAYEKIKQGKIRLIQFEFNVANILSRVFLKDFYDLLGNSYNFYRLDANKIIPLGDYDSTNEIFKFQNILAINKNTMYESTY